MALTIGQAAKRTGVAARTIRFYEGAGVMPAPGRSAAGYRQYSDDGVQQLLFIRRARALGLRLPQLRALTSALRDGPRGSVRTRVREVVRAHLSTVRAQLRELELLERHLATVLRRMRSRSRSRAAGRCRCLDPVAPTARVRPEIRAPRQPGIRPRTGSLDRSAARSRLGPAMRAMTGAVRAEGPGSPGSGHQR